ncbi:hypothetical protein [Variovorax sp. LjRoot175]|uniref:hypothetical protein n=1 Tax=Variovorax sp. LjRoot175 TaxID=3342276 RepID=UPI003F50E51C
MIADEELHRHAAENLAQADALIFGRSTYEMMEAAWRPEAYRHGQAQDGQHAPGRDARLLAGHHLRRRRVLRRTVARFVIASSCQPLIAPP